MKKISKVLAVVFAAIIVMSCCSLSSFAAPFGSKDRYSVLVLDVSGSMAGNPLSEMKEGAKAFCNQVLGSNRSNNKIAIVKFSDYAATVSGFSSDEATLNSAIDGLTDEGMTNLSDGLSTAKGLLDSISGDVIKNILVMCDGYPNDGGGAQGAYNVIKSIPLFWNVYGLYYCPDNFNAGAEDVMKHVGRNGYTKVEDGSALRFSFIDNGTTITNKSVNNVIVRIACPVDVSVSLFGETLDRNNTKTTFGTLSFEGADGETKVLNLAYRNDYIIDITGFGNGTMDYDISYRCNNDELYKLSYPTVDITPSTHITTGINIDNSSMALSVDDNNDGLVDRSVSPKASPSNLWYRIKNFFKELLYKINDLFGGSLFC